MRDIGDVCIPSAINVIEMTFSDPEGKVEESGKKSQNGPPMVKSANASYNTSTKGAVEAESKCVISVRCGAVVESMSQGFRPFAEHTSEDSPNNC